MRGLELLYFLVQQMMYFSMPLLIVALGGLFSERSGVVNIALEGIMVIGALASVLFIFLMQQFSILSGNGLLLIAFLIAAVAGTLYSLLHAYAAINMKANQVISGTALNLASTPFAVFIGRLATGTVIGRTVQQIPFKNQFRITKVPVLGDIPFMGPLFFQNTYITTYLCILILLISWIILYKTKFGLRLRACGEHPQAADSVGINVYRIRYAGVMISGALAGIGGLVFVIPTSTNFNASVAGYGFLALAVLIFGQWKPWRVFAAAIFFGFMKTISASSSSIAILAQLPISSEVYKMIPYIATLIILVFSSKNSQAPRAAGQPYDQGAR